MSDVIETHEFHGIKVRVSAKPVGEKAERIALLVETRNGVAADKETQPGRGTEAGKVRLVCRAALAIEDMAPEVGAEILIAVLARMVAPYVEAGRVWQPVAHGLFQAMQVAPERARYGLRAAWWYLQEKELPNEALEYIGHGVQHNPRGGRSAAEAAAD